MNSGGVKESITMPPIDSAKSMLRDIYNGTVTTSTMRWIYKSARQPFPENGQLK